MVALMTNNYQLIKSKRKSLGISIKSDGKIIIRVPLKTSRKIIEDFITKYQPWINNKLAKLAQLHELKNTQLPANSFYYLGQAYPIQAGKTNLSLPFFDGTSMSLDPEFMDSNAEILLKWYQSTSKKLVEPIMQNYAQQFNLGYKNIKITRAEYRWGSCNSNGTICFSYKIAMLPIEVITYIVVHELAHLKHLNHSQHFWQQVALMYPNYKSAIQWLKNNKHFSIFRL